MARDWFLCNGKDGQANTVCLLNASGELRRTFPDIAHLDLSTMKIPPKDVRERLREYNEDADLSGKFFDLTRQSKDNRIKTYPTVFDYMTIRNCRGTIFCMKYLEYFAEQRKHKFDRNFNLQLEDDKDLHRCINETMKVMTSIYYDDLTTYGSIIPLILKQLLAEYQGKSYLLTLSDFIESRSGILYNVYSNYPALRNILIELMNCTIGKDPNIRTVFAERNKWQVTGIEPEKYQQMSLFNEEQPLVRKKGKK